MTAIEELRQLVTTHKETRSGRPPDDELTRQLVLISEAILELDARLSPLETDGK